MEFAHCDTSSAHLSLHDCIAEKAYFADGKLGFLLSDGFWISPDHPESDLPALVRTDAANFEEQMMAALDETTREPELEL